MRAQEISILPQVDGPVLVPTRDYDRGRVSDNTRLVEQEYSQGGTYIQGASITQRREYPRESSEDDNINRRPYREWRPPERGRYPNQSGRPPNQGRYPNRDGRPPRRGGYSGGGPPDGGGPPNGDRGPPGEDPLMMEDPLMEMEDPLVETRTTQSSRTSWTSKTCNSPDSSSNTGYLYFGEYFQFSGTIYAAIGQSARSN